MSFDNRKKNNSMVQKSTFVSDEFASSIESINVAQDIQKRLLDKVEKVLWLTKAQNKVGSFVKDQA